MQVQDELYRSFLAASGQQAADFTPVTYALADLITQLGEVQRSTVTQVAATQSKSQTQAQGAQSESTFEKVLKSGFGVSPIISGLIDLFTSTEEPAPLYKYAQPRSIAFQAAETRDGLTTADYDQGGVARAYGKSAGASYEQGAVARAYGNTTTSDYDPGRVNEAYPSTGTLPRSPAQAIQVSRDVPGLETDNGGGSVRQQITVNVSAMDARSFLDRSGDIALAVREAMLNLNSINDVVNDL